MNIKVQCGEEWTSYQVYDCTNLVFESWLRGGVTFDEVWKLTYSGDYERNRNVSDGEVSPDAS